MEIFFNIKYIYWKKTFSSVNKRTDDKNILVEFGAKIHTHAKYVHGCIFKIVLVLL